MTQYKGKKGYLVCIYGNNYVAFYARKNVTC